MLAERTDTQYAGEMSVSTVYLGLKREVVLEVGGQDVHLSLKDNELDLLIHMLNNAKELLEKNVG